MLARRGGDGTPESWHAEEDRRGDDDRPRKAEEHRIHRIDGREVAIDVFDAEIACGTADDVAEHIRVAAQGRDSHAVEDTRSRPITEYQNSGRMRCVSHHTSPMKVRITRLDKSLPLPVYETAGAVGFDLLARVDVVIAPDEIALIPANVIVETPEGYAFIVASRSSTPRKKGLTTPHGLGIIDQDYCGPDDEVKIQVKNFTSAPVTITRGEKVAQGLFVRCDRADFVEVDAIERPTRGGFGSTDSK